MINDKTFVQLATMDDTPLAKNICNTQNRMADVLDNWDPRNPLVKLSLKPNPRFMWKDPKTLKVVIPPDEDLRRHIMQVWHDRIINGHPGRDETTQHVQENYYWPNARTWIAEYVKGCATCQQMKNLTHRQQSPLYPFSVPINP